MIEKMKVKSDEEIQKVNSVKEKRKLIDKKSTKTNDLLKRIEVIEGYLGISVD